MIGAESSVRRVRVVAIDAHGVETGWTVTWADWLPTVDDLSGAVGLSPGGLWIDGELCLPDEPLDAIDLFDGVEVSNVARPSEAVEPQAPVRLRLDHIGGFGAGGRLELAPGPIAAVRSTTALESSHRLAGSVQAIPESEQRRISLHSDNHSHNELDDSGSTTADVWGPGTVAVLGGDVFEVQTIADQPAGGSARRRSHVVHRQPRLVADQQIRQVTRPDLPRQPASPAPFSWLLLLAPLPVGVLIAIVFRPYFLLFTMMGPLMSIARWVEGRRRFFTAMREWDEQCDRLESRFRSQVSHVTQREVARRRSAHPTIVDLADRVTQGASVLWERRAAHGDFMQLCVGYHDVLWCASSTGSLESSGTEPVGTEVRLELVPHAIEVSVGSVIGLVGERSAIQSVARGLVLQATALHGPADLAVGVRGHESAPEWRWCQWLPHYVDGFGIGDTLTLIVEPFGADRAGDLVQKGESPAASLLVLADTIAELPATCSTIVVCGDLEIEVLDVDSGDRLTGVAPIGCSMRLATRVARSMARLRDPERAALHAFSRDGVALVDLIDVGSCVDQWSKPRDEGGLRAVVGYGTGSDTSPVMLDLVADGPHALVAGTTGSGKSEFLRTLVVSLACGYRPSECSFVLIDFKGGGAFDALNSLPHVAAVVTDLDTGIAERALKSLRAELQDREERLRAAGATDLSEYQRSGCGDLGRLVLVIDEFATLASDLPEFLTGLVDIAQRGRSLGVHLVLATQRPAGVLDNKIRANTNLRLCLRVQDQAESRDVVGTADAAAIPTDAVGRAVLRVGAEPARTIQCAHLGPGMPRPAAGSLSATRFPGQGRSESGTDVARTPVASGLEPTLAQQTTADLVSEICAAGNQVRLGPARCPWLDLPCPEPDPNEFWATQWADPNSVPLGRCDIPESRSQPIWTWQWSDGPLAVIGGTRNDRESAAALLAGGPSWYRQSVPSRGPIDCYLVSNAPVGDRSSGRLLDLDDVERISRLLDRCSEAISQPSEGREQRGPRVLVVINGYERVAAGADPKLRTALLARIDDLVADRSGRVAVALIAANERGIPLRVLSSVRQRVVLPLADSGAYATFGLRVRDLPVFGDLCGVDPSTGHLVQLCCPPQGHDLDSLVDPVDRCPELVCAAQLTPRATPIDSPISIPVGLDMSSLEPAHLDLAGVIGLVGGPGSGRTNALHTVAFAARRASSSLRITSVLSSHPARHRTRSADGLADRADGSITDAVIAPAGFDYRLLINGGLSELGPSGECGWLVLIDDAGQLDPEVGQAFVEAAGERSGLTVVVAGSPHDFRSIRSWCHALVDGRSAVVFSDDRRDTEIFRSPVVGYPGIAWRPGDATLTSAARSAAVRWAVAPGR